VITQEKLFKINKHSGPKVVLSTFEMGASAFGEGFGFAFPSLFSSLAVCAALALACDWP
jgi:hypothetical protein